MAVHSLSFCIQWNSWPGLHRSFIVCHKQKSVYILPNALWFSIFPRGHRSEGLETSLHYFLHMHIKIPIGKPVFHCAPQFALSSNVVHPLSLKISNASPLLDINLIGVKMREWVLGKWDVLHLPESLRTNIRTAFWYYEHASLEVDRNSILQGNRKNTNVTGYWWLAAASIAGIFGIFRSRTRA